MKILTAFFLLGLTIMHVIYAIVAPNVPKTELERVARKEAAALSRFHKSKRYAPIPFSPKRRNDLATRIWNYVKYAKVMGKRFIASSKTRLESRLAYLHKGFPMSTKFLVSSIARFDNDIADLNVPKAEMGSVPRRKAVVLSRFYGSKRYAPVSFPQKHRNGLATRLSTYVKYARILSKRFLTSMKTRLETQVSDLRNNFLTDIDSGHTLSTSDTHPDAGSKETQGSGVFAFQNDTKRNVALERIGIMPRAEQKLPKWSAVQVTASAYETFKQVALELVSRIQHIAVNATPITFFQSLKKSEYEVGRVSPKDIAEHMAIGWPPCQSAQPLSQRLWTQREGEELTSSIYVPVPSAAPSVERFPATSLESSQDEGLMKTPEMHDVIFSGSPESSGTTSDIAAFYLGAK